MARIAVIPGDGIGPEVIPHAVAALRAVAELRGLSFDFVDLPFGAEHFLATGETITDRAIDEIRSGCDAVLLGAVGDPRVPSNRHARDILLGLRFKLDLFVNFRPVRLLHERLTPLKDRSPTDIDFVIFRENTEGVYGGVGGVMREGTPHEVATQVDVTTRFGVERICRAAFEYASSHGRTRVTMSDKANAMEFVGGVWRRTFAAVAAEYPDIETETVYVDALAMDLVRRPDRYQVIVTGNLFGDILSDIGAEIAGGPGLAPSANLHPGRVSLFEPVHGSAPDIAGTGLANPIASILSASLLLEHLGDPEGARLLERAVHAAVAARETTPDLGGSLDTAAAGEAVRFRIASADG